MKTSNGAIVGFSRDLQRLAINLGRVLSELSLRPIYGPPPICAPSEEQLNWYELRSEWGLDLESVDVTTNLRGIESQLDSLRQRSVALSAFDRDDPMPWFAEYNGEFDDLPDNYPPQELVNRWRSKPPTSLAAGLLTFAETCVSHLQYARQSAELPTISGHWYSVLGLLTNGTKFEGRMVCELVAARSKPAAKVDVDGVVSVESVAANGPVDSYKWRHAGLVTEDMLQQKAWLMCKFLWRQLDRVATFDELKTPVYQDREHPAGRDSFGSLRRAANNYFKSHSIPLKVSVDQRQWVVRLLDFDWTDE